MKFITRSVVFALCLLLLLVQNGSSQAANSRPRRAAAVSDVTAGVASLRESTARPVLESLVPRDGLQLYFEMRNGGLSQLAGVPGALASLRKLLSGDGGAPADTDLAGFAMKNMGLLASARIVFVSYGTRGRALFVETASTSDAERLAGEMGRLLAAKSNLRVAQHGSVVIAGAGEAVNRLEGSEPGFTLVEDQEFKKAQAHFSTEPFFAFLETGSALPLPMTMGGDTGQNAAYAAGMMAAFNSIPYAIAVGGSIESGTARMRALLMYSPKQTGGLFTSLMSAARMAEPQASGFAAPNSDLFIDLMVDWEKLYEGLESLFATITASQPNSGSQPGAIQGGDIVAMMESRLGFSIKKDLLPTLGGELAVSIAGLGELASLRPNQARRRVASPSFTVMLALKDPVKFESYFNKLFTGMGGGLAQPFASAPYRGTAIKYNKSMAYAISGRFFVGGGSVAQIRRALDARAANRSLASTPEFSQAVGAPRPVMLQVYVSAGALNGLFKSLSTGAAKMNSATALPVPASQLRSAVGVTMVPDADGLMLEARVPSDLAVMALAAMASDKTSPYGIRSQAVGARPAGRRTPTLTDEDLRSRRP